MLADAIIGSPFFFIVQFVRVSSPSGGRVSLKALLVSGFMKRPLSPYQRIDSHYECRIRMLSVSDRKMVGLNRSWLMRERIEILRVETMEGGNLVEGNDGMRGLVN